jgi:hypothetical protein
MKRTFTTLALAAALLLTVGVSSSFAHNTGNGNDNINTSFRKDFSQADLLSTSTNDNYTKFTFKLNGAVLTAFYTNKGELLAITHNITSTQLPLTLLLQIKKNYADYWISDLFELNANGDTNYYITLENADKKVTLRSSENTWESFSKTAKE